MSAGCVLRVSDCLFKTPRLDKMVKDPKFGDIIVKCAGDVIFPTGRLIAEIAGNDRAVEGFQKAEGFAKDARMVTALATCYVSGTISGIISGTKEIKSLGSSMVSSARDSDAADFDLVRYADRDQLKHNDVAHGFLEKLLVLVYKVVELVGTLTYAIGFLVCRPFIFLKKCFGSLGKAADGIGQQFSLVMMINHAAGVVGSSVKVAFLGKAYHRAINGTDGEARHDQYRSEFFKKLKDTVLNWVSNGLEFFMDIMPRVGQALPLEAKIPVSAIIVGIGFYKVWEKAA